MGHTGKGVLDKEKEERREEQGHALSGPRCPPAGCVVV